MFKKTRLLILLTATCIVLSGCDASGIFSLVKSDELGDTTDGDEETTDAVDVPTATPETFSYIDAEGNRYEAIVDQAVEKHHYNWSMLEHEKGSENIFYDDGDYTIVKGVDVSHHNGDINWKKVKAAGYEFAFLRLGYRGYGSGKLLVDREFQTSFKAARKAGMKLGVYFFSQAVNEEEALEEAELTLVELNNSKLDLPVVFDPELIPEDDARTDGVSGTQFTNNTIAFCERIREAGYDVMVYSNLYWEARVFELSRLNDYPLWYADYTATPQTPYRFDFWQYSESGKVDGIPGDADLDVMFVRKNG